MTDDSDEYPPINLYDRLVATLSHHSISRETAELLSLQLAGGVSRQHSTGRTIRGQIHLGILFDAETDTAALLTHLNELSPDSTYVNGTGCSTSGLIADARSGTVDTGVVLSGDYDSVFIDNAASLSEGTKDALDQILSRGSYTISKSGIHETCDTSSSIVVADTLQYGSREDIMGIDEELGHLLPPSTKNRLDVASIDSGESFDTEKVALGRDKIHSGLERARKLDPELKPGTADYLEKKFDDRTDFDYATISIETVRRLAEACARLNYKETVGANHVDTVTDLVNRVLVQMYRKPDDEKGDQSDGDIVTTGSSKGQRERINNIKKLIAQIENEYEEGAPVEVILERAESQFGWEESKTSGEVQNLRHKGELYEPTEDHLRTT